MFASKWATRPCSVSKQQRTRYSNNASHSASVRSSPSPSSRHRRKARDGSVPKPRWSAASNTWRNGGGPSSSSVNRPISLARKCHESQQQERAFKKKRAGDRGEFWSFSCERMALAFNAVFRPENRSHGSHFWRDHLALDLPHRFQSVDKALNVVCAGPPAAFGSAALLPAPPPTVAASPVAAAATSQTSVRHRLHEVFVANMPVFPTLQL